MTRFQVGTSSAMLVHDVAKVYGVNPHLIAVGCVVAFGLAVGLMLLDAWLKCDRYVK